jgi:hypothetical protein
MAWLKKTSVDWIYYASEEIKDNYGDQSHSIKYG